MRVNGQIVRVCLKSEIDLSTHVGIRLTNRLGILCAYLGIDLQ